MRTGQPGGLGRPRPLVLERVDHVVFRDDSYEWIDLSQFAATTDDADPIALLNLLLADRRHYVNRYYVADDNPSVAQRNGEGGPDFHGSYLMSAISPDRFVQVDGRQARDALMAWVDDGREDNPRPIPHEGDLDGILASLEQAPVVFLLPELGEDAWHERGFLVDPFFELITINVRRQTVGLLAAGAD